jgi:hypothetical protein
LTDTQRVRTSAVPLDCSVGALSLGVELGKTRHRTSFSAVVNDNVILGLVG